MTTPNGAGASSSGGWFPNRLPPAAPLLRPGEHPQQYPAAGGAFAAPGGWPTPAGSPQLPPPQATPYRPPPPPPPTAPIYASPHVQQPLPPIQTSPPPPPPVQRWSPYPTASPRSAGLPPMTPTAHPHAPPQASPHAYPHAPPPMPIGPNSPALLISLADAYLEAAHKNGYLAATKKGADAKEYFKLVATGLGCLEAALKWRLQPRVEAMVRLQYASVLFEETENLQLAEDLLNKGMIVAQRNNLLELKYRMQYLLVRIMFRTSPKAAIRMLNAHIEEAETLDIPLWAYSFRFLRSSLLIETSDPSIREPQAAILALQKTSNLAKLRHDVGVLALASLMEAMVCLLPGGEGMEAAQRAMARANSQQLSASEYPAQLEVLTQILDIICFLMMGNSLESNTRVRKLHAMLDDEQKWASWRENGEFELMVNSNRQGKPPDRLTLQWFSKDDVFVLGYFLSGLCKFQKNVEEGGKAEKYLAEGVKIADGFMEAMQASALSFESAKSKLAWKHTLKCYMLLYHTFLLCVRTAWDEALRYFQHLEAVCAIAPHPVDPSLLALMTYLRATLCHGTNELAAALSLYVQTCATSPPDSELYIVATLNQIMILRIYNPGQAQALQMGIERMCTSSKNALIRTAFVAVKATERGELIKTKNHLALALQMATNTCNQQLTFIVLSFMCHRFFSGVVSEQAEKSAKAALQNAKKGRDNLWSLMAGEMYADCLERKGQEEEASRQRAMNDDSRAAVVQNLLRQTPTLYAPPPPPPPPPHHGMPGD